MAALDRSGAWSPLARSGSSHPRRSARASGRGRRAPARDRRATGSRRRGPAGRDSARRAARGALVPAGPVLDGDGALTRPAARRSGSTATRGARPGPRRGVVRGRPVRAASSSSAPMTATTSRAPGDRRRARLRLAARRRSETSSGARRSTRRARRSTRCASIAPAAPTSASGDARSMAHGRRARSSDRRRPTPASGGRSRPSSPGIVAGDRLAVQSCGEVACRTRVIAPGGGPTRDARRARSSVSIVGLDGDLARDLRGVSRTPLPDRRDRPRARASAGSSRRPPVWPSWSRPPDGARLVHEVGAGNDRRSAVRRARRPTRRSTSGSIPDDLRLHPSAVRAGAAHDACRRAGSCSLPRAACRPTPAPTARSSATSRTARPSSSMRPCDDHRQPTRASSRSRPSPCSSRRVSAAAARSPTAPIPH